MKIAVLFKISVKYLWRYKRRYVFLFLALGFGFGVLTVISSLKDGMNENLYFSAQAHYAGDIIAVGHKPDLAGDYHLTKYEQDAVILSAQAAGIDTGTIAIRTLLHGMDDGSVFFNGNTIALKNIVGADWEQEKAFFDKLSYIHTPDLLHDNSILISAPIAEELWIQQGDSVILELITVTGQKNTGNFIVSGIVDDSSFFNYYKVYISRLTMNRLIGFEDDDCSLIGFYIPNRRVVEQKRLIMNNDLQERILAGPLVYDRDGLREEMGRYEEESAIFLLTLPVYLSEVDQLMLAIDIASFVLFAMMLAIIMVSAVVSCALILHERTRETGTMHAIGFYEGDLRFVLQLEIAALALFSIVTGFFLALGINWLLSFGSYSWFPGFEIFMQDGRLAARYLPLTLFVNIVLTGCALAAAIGGPIFRHSRNPLPEMLRGGIL